MDSSTSDFITQKALRYGLHSCSYCQAILVDLTVLAYPGTKDDSLIDENDYDDSDQILTLYYKDQEFRQFRFSKEFVNETARSCLLFELLKENGKVFSGLSIYMDKTSTEYAVGPSDIGIVYLRFPTEITSLISGFNSHGLLIEPCIDIDRDFACAREMLSKCLTMHENCKQTGTSPSRLLDLGQNKIRLVDTESLDDPAWAALSYCWGGPQKAQTTPLNIQDRYRNISLEELPLTIRDAIHVCHQMHIQYLWVDSLCIIQTHSDTAGTTEESDKDRELRKMAGIFSGAILTISASCASSAEEGFLRDRQVWPPGIALPVRVGETFDIAQIFAYVGRSFRPNFGPDPVDDRAWIFQEQTLAGRTLNFRTRAMHFQCQVEGKCISQGHEYNRHSWRMSRIQNWHGMVEEYSQRDVTDIRDRPIAIAAVAERFSRASRNVFRASDYLAGLWKPDLQRYLLWGVPCPADETIELQGPSWSWTTISSPISWPYMKFEDVTARIISTDIHLANPNLLFGAVKSGSIRLKGWMTRTSRRVQSYKEGDGEGLICYYDRKHEPGEVFLLEIGINPTISKFNRLGLILRMAEKETKFMRVGSFEERIHEGCKSWKHLPCLPHRNHECKCMSDIPLGGCGWTCDRKRRVIDII